MNQLPVCSHFVAAKGAGTSIGATVQVWTSSLRPGMEISPCRGVDDAGRNWFCFVQALSGFVDPYRFGGYWKYLHAEGATMPVEIGFALSRLFPASSTPTSLCVN